MGSPDMDRSSRPQIGLRPALAVAALLLGQIGTLAQQMPERVGFLTNVPSSTVKSVALRGALYLPSGTPPFSAVVITPSSGGEKVDREHHYAQELAKAGIAGLVVESFGSRGLTSSVRDQSLLTSWETENDAIAAFRWLVRDGRFRPDRIGVTGVSKGGSVALHTALAVRRRWSKSEDLVFAAHAPIAPPCNIPHRTLRTTGKPIFFMLAEHDDQTRAAPCVNLAEAIRGAGNSSVSVKIYEGAHHAWETLGSQPYFDPSAQNFSDCRGLVEDDGTWITPAGERVSPNNHYQVRVRTCVRLGTHCCGGTPTLKVEATRDLIAFFKRAGF